MSKDARVLQDFLWDPNAKFRPKVVLGVVLPLGTLVGSTSYVFFRNKLMELGVTDYYVIAVLSFVAVCVLLGYWSQMQRQRAFEKALYLLARAKNSKLRCYRRSDFKALIEIGIVHDHKRIDWMLFASDESTLKGQKIAEVKLSVPQAYIVESILSE